MILAPKPTSSGYPVNFEDAAGNKPQAGQRDRIHFEADSMLPVDSSRPLGMYGTDVNQVLSPIERYSIGDRTARLSKDSNGGLTIYPQPKSPGDDHEANRSPSRYYLWYVP